MAGDFLIGAMMRCRVCDGTDLHQAVDLGVQPWANHFLRPEEVGTEARYPLRVVWCAGCATAQLDYSVAKEVMFSDHTYLSGVTRSLSAHFQRVAQEVDWRFFSCVGNKSVLDIGSNDGTQLKHFQAMGYDVLGVESSRTTAKIAADNGVPTVNAFFNLDLAMRLGRQFHVINAAGVFFHLEELHSVAEAIRHCLRNDGVFVVQFLYMKKILENGAFDQIYHEHLLYYTLRTIQTLLGRHGLAMFDAELSPIHGGSIIGYVGHAGGCQPSARLQSLRREEERSGCNELASYRSFSRRIERMKRENLSFLHQMKQQGKRVLGMGAPVKGNTLLNTFGIGPELIECLVEKNELRAGLVSPGMHIPIVLEREIDRPPEVYYVLAWNFRTEILANNRKLIESGTRFYFPVEADLTSAAEAA